MSDQEVARIQEQIKTLFNDLSEVKADMKEIKAQLASRLPAWATIAISCLTAAVGWFAGH